METEEPIQLIGTVSQVSPDGTFLVRLPNGHVVFGHIAAKMRNDIVGLGVGDQVQVEMSPYDLGKARITSQVK